MTYTSDMPSATKKTAVATKKVASKKTQAKKQVIAKPQRKNPGLPESKLKTMLSEIINVDINAYMAPSKRELSAYNKAVRELEEKRIARPEPVDVPVTREENGLTIPVTKTVREKGADGKYLKDKFVTKVVTKKQVVYDPITEEQAAERESFVTKFKKSYLKKFTHEKRAYSAKKIRFSKGALYVLSSLLDKVTLEIFKAAVAQRKKTAKKVTRGVIKLNHLFESDFMNIPGIELFSGTSEFINELVAYHRELLNANVKEIQKNYRKELRSEGLLKRRQKSDESSEEESTEEVKSSEEQVADDNITVVDEAPEESTLGESKEISLKYYLKDWFKSADNAAVSAEFAEFIESLVKSLLRKIAIASYKTAVEEDIQKINLHTMVEFLTLLSIGEGNVSRTFKLVDIDIPDEDEVKKHEKLKAADKTYKYKKSDLPTEPSVEAISEDHYEGESLSFVLETLDQATSEYEVIREADKVKRKAAEERRLSKKQVNAKETVAPAQEKQSEDSDEEEPEPVVKKVVKKVVKATK